MLIISCTIFVVSILTFYVWHQIEAIRMGYEIGKLEEKVFNLSKEVERLETKKSYLLRLERVEKIAKEELMLVKPKKEQLIYDEFSPEY